MDCALIPGNILVAGADEAGRRSLTALLEGCGHRVHCAPDGISALDSMERCPYDLVMADIQLPRMDGFEVCRRIREDERYRDVPVLLLGGADEEISRCFDVGAADHLAQPVRRAEVSARVAIHLALRRARRELQSLRDREAAETKRLDAVDRTMGELSETLGGSGLPLEKLAYCALQQAMALTGSARGYVAILDPDSGECILHALSGCEGDISGSDEATSAHLERGADGKYPGFLGTVLDTGKSFFLNEIPQREAGNLLPRCLLPASNFLCVPARMGGKVLGLVAVCGAAGGYEDAALRVVGRLTELFAVALARELLLENLQQSERRFQTIFEQASDAVFLYDAAGHLVDVNQRACDLLGYSREELLIRRLDEIDMAMPRGDLLAIFEEITAEGKPVESRGRFLHRKGHEVFVEIMAGPVRSGGKDLILSIVRDVTQKRKIEETLYFIARIKPSESEKGYLDELASFLCRILEIEYAVAAELLPGGRRARIVGSYAKTDIQYPREYDLAGSPCERVSGKKVCIYPSRLRELFPKDEGLKTLGVECYVGVPLWGADGRAIGHLAVLGCKPLSDTNAVVSILQIAAMRAAQEIEQRRSRAALVQEKVFTQSVFANLPGMVWVIDERGKVKLWNRNSESLVAGLTGNTPVQSFLRAVRKADRRKVAAATTRIGPEGEATVELVLTDLAGRQFPALCTCVRIDLPEGRYSLFVAVDISAHQETERKLHRLGKAIEQAAEAVIIMSSDGTIRFVNPAFETLTGKTAEEAIGRDIREVCGGIHEGAHHTDLLAAAARDGHWKGKLSCVGRAGASLVVEATISAVFDEKGRVINFISIQRDITKERELEARLSQAQRLEAIGTLAGGIAHDFNNILTAVMGYTQLAMEEGAGNERVTGALDEVLNAANRAKELVKQILTFSRQGPEERRPLQIGLVVKESLKLLRASLPSSIEFKVDVSSRSVAVADSTQIHQVVMNLCTNAGLAMKNRGGVLSVALEDVEVTEEEAAPHPKMTAGPYIRLSVGDTGCGIPVDIIGRIFEPFFTTRSEGEGSGMGLSVVHGIVEGHGGAVTVQSEEGSGAVFRVYLPRVVAASAPVRARQVSQMPRGSERVLFVDDEESHVHLAKRMLGKLGYTVTALDCAPEALELFLSAPEAFDLLITDLTMPGMRGDELCSRVTAVRPGFPVILCTGLSDADTLERVEACGAKGFLLKPFVLSDLAVRIREVLGS